MSDAQHDPAGSERTAARPRTGRPAALLAVAAGRLAGAVSRGTGRGRGNTLPGRVGLRLAPGLLRRLAEDRTVLVVSGTNGKTTTTRLLAAALATGGPVLTNGDGSNLRGGLATTLMRRVDDRSAPVVLEVDERVLSRSAAELAPRVVVLLNLTRDQLDRTAEVAGHVTGWAAALGAVPGARVVANADDPLVCAAVLRARPGATDVTWVAAGQPWRQDSPLCPFCGHAWETSTWEAPDAAWSCARCGAARPAPDWRLTGDQLAAPAQPAVRLQLALPGRANRANAAMAAAAAACLGVPVGAALDAMTGVADVDGRYLSADVDGVLVRLLLAKNPAGWAEVLAQLAHETGPVVVAVNARDADGRDTSWLWDVPFEQLRGRVVVAAGERSADVALRLRYAGVEHTRHPEALRGIVPLADRSAWTVVANYTAFTPVREQLLRRRTAPAGRVRADGLRIAVLFPELLGSYGDGGNVVVLRQRLAWRGLGHDVRAVPLAAPVPRDCDVYVLGGGEDRAQLRALEALARSPGLQRAASAGATVLAVCAGLQLLGLTLTDRAGFVSAGLGLVDAHTRMHPTRALGEVVARPLPELGLPLLTGFANHAGRTRLGPAARPLATVVSGPGNDTAADSADRAGGGRSRGTPDVRAEGALQGSVIATYLHGPVLARNPALADLVLSRALRTTLAPVVLPEADAVRGERLRGLTP